MSQAALPDYIGPYRVLRPIARGGMAEVYEVEDPVSGEHLAAKLLVQTGGALPRFNREFEAMVRLNHPNIVRVYHYGHMGESPWITMELVAGTPIQAYTKRQGKPGTEARTQEVLRVAHDLALALDHIHRRGLIHRDLKSANVLVLPDGRVKLIDFGTARVSNALEEITREGEFIGTFAYASPEQILQKPLDHRSDLYSLGVLLYRLCTGKRPFNSNDLHELARQHVRDQPRPPRQRTPELPVGLEELVMRLLSKDPNERPQTGAEVAELLEAIAGAPLFLSGQLHSELAQDSLVGRESQMAAMWRTLDRVQNGELPPASLTLVTGLQGSGRHRFLASIEADLCNRNWRVLNWFIHRDGDPIDTLAHVLHELARSFEAQGHVGRATEALDQVIRNPAMPASERTAAVVKAGSALLAYRVHLDALPLACLVRGLHNAGAVGTEVLTQLRTSLLKAGVRMLFIGELLSTADTENSLVRKRFPEAERIDLPPLDIRQVAMLVGSLLRRKAPPGTVASRIHQATGGMPAYVEEVVRGLVSQGLLRVQGRDPNRIEWAAQDHLTIPVPALAKDSLRRELSKLPADRIRLLEALSLMDGVAAVAVLAAAIDRSEEELVDAVEELCREGWVTQSDGGRLMHLRQLLAVTVLLEQINPCRLHSMKRQLAQQVEGESAFIAQIRLFVQVGRLEDAASCALDLALHHLAHNEPVSALQALDLVVPKANEADLDNTDRAKLYQMHVEALLLARPTDVQISRSLLAASRLAEGQGSHFKAELHLLRARVQQVIGHYPNFRKHLMEAWRLVEHEPPTSLAATVADQLGWSNRAAGAVDAAATWHGRARRIAAQLGTPHTRARADVGVAGWQYARGLLLESEQTTAAAIDIFEQTRDARGLALALPIWSASLRQQGRYSEVLERLNALAPIARVSEAPSSYVRLLLATAWAEVDVCRLGRAQECVDELAATLRKGEHLNLRLEADLVWGRILLASGQYEDAVRRLHHVRSRSKNAGLQLVAALAEALVGETLYYMGDHEAGFETCRDAVAALNRAGHVPATADACAAHARAMGSVLSAESLFEPVIAYIEHQPCIALHLEATLSSARFAASQQQDAAPLWLQAQETLQSISETLSATDQAVLYLHPWAQQVRLGLEAS